MLGIRYIIIIIGLLIVPQVHADLVVSEIGSLGGEPLTITAIDSNSDGVPDTAVIGTSSNAVAFGTSPWTESVMNVRGVAPVDFDKNGRMNGVVVAGKDIVAMGPSGSVLWRVKNVRGYSAVAADLDGDGYKDEVVIGCWDMLAAFDSGGESLWNYTEVEYIRNIAITEEFIIASTGKMLYFFKLNGELRYGKAQNGNIVAISPIDLEGDGTMNGVVVITKGDDNYAKINAYTMEGVSMGWSTSLRHESGAAISASPVDKYSTGRKENVVINLEGGAYWISSRGAVTKIGNVYTPGAIAPIDFDGDKILDDLLISTKGSAGKLYAYSAYGQELSLYNRSGGVKIAAVDLTFDGTANDAIVATSFDKRVYSVISDVTDSTTSTAPPTTTTTTTTPSPQDTAAPVTTQPPATTQAPADSSEISVDLGPDKSAMEGVEVALTASATPSTSGGIIVSHIWTEDNTVLGLDESLSKIFSIGEHEIKVVVTDNIGAKAEDTVKITVTAAGTGSTPSGDSDSDGWTDELEIRMGTDPDNPDTDEDGIIDSKDPNPLVANGQGALSSLGGYMGPLVKVVMWVVIVGGIIIVLIYIREKVLDLLWDRRRDIGE